MDTRQIAWLAGLYEGEGYLTIVRRNGITSPQLGIGMTDEDVIRQVCDLLNFGGLTIENRYPGKTLYRWRSSCFEGVQALVAAMWPWLSVRRRIRIVEVFIEVRNAERTYKLRKVVPVESFLKAMDVEVVRDLDREQMVGGR